MSRLLINNKPRFSSIDVLRGAIMLIMALDHVRDYFHIAALSGNPTDMGTTTPVLFFTRWITHFCAPIFVFLAGLSAYISGQRKTKKELSAFLIKRGTWLLVVEIVIITLALTFNPLYNLFILQVIWATGWSMIILGLLVRASYTWVLATGLILFFGHNVLDHIDLPQQGAAAVWWRTLLTGSTNFYSIGSNRFIMVAYAILPWTGIMLLGYAAGCIYQKDFNEQKRKKILTAAGLGLLLLFVLLRAINQYGDPSHWATQKNGITTFLSFLNVTKYPVSLQYACLTLAPALLILACMEKVSNRFTRFLAVYGRVPFFYYVIHFFLIHLLCVGAFFISGHTLAEAIDLNSPFLFRPVNYGYSLTIVYIVWLGVICIMYYPCRWFNRYKQTHTQWWLSYI